MFMQHFYIAVSHDTTVYELPMDFTEYTELVPADDFESFTALEGKYPIYAGNKGTQEPDPVPETCLASYLLGTDDPRLDTLRQFRDNALADSKTGRALIKAYYDQGDAMISLCEKSPAVKQSLKQKRDIGEHIMITLETFLME